MAGARTRRRASHMGPVSPKNLQRLGLACVILFAPGGFILGAALAADHLRRRYGWSVKS